MSFWEIYKGSDSEWDQNVYNYNAHYRQSTIWANLKKRKSWKTLRLINQNKKKTFIQIFYKKYFFITFFYCAGGPIGSVNNLDKSFIEFISKYTNSKMYYIRIDDGSTDKVNLDFFQNSDLWKRPLYRMNDSRFALFQFLPGVDENNIFEDGTRDFRSSVKSCMKKKLNYTHTHSPNSDHLAEISISMYKKKKIKMMEYNDFENFKKTLGKNIHFVIAYDEDNIPLAYRAILILNDKAWDVAAATSFRGRKLFAGFGIMYEIFKKLINISVKEYNLGALTAKPNGINAFKIGTGAKEKNYTGEFEYSNVIFLNQLINILISLTLSKKFYSFNFLRRLYF